MARSRVIRPEFWSDEKLATVSRDARLLFAGMWTTSDDYGATKGQAAWLRSQIFPYDEDLDSAKIDNWLANLAEIGCIIRFKANGEIFYYLPKFLEHQKIDKPSKRRNPKFAEELRESRETVASLPQISADETETETETESETETEAISSINLNDEEIPEDLEGQSLALFKFKRYCKESWSEVRELLSAIHYIELTDPNSAVSQVEQLSRHVIQGTMYVYLQSDSDKVLASLAEKYEGNWLAYIRKWLDRNLVDVRENRPKPSAFKDPMSKAEEDEHLKRHQSAD